MWCTLFLHTLLKRMDPTTGIKKDIVEVAQEIMLGFEKWYVWFHLLHF